MDAAAFPTSVGVNPSATIAAVAEYKIEQFIQRNGNTSWTAMDHQNASRWIAEYSRAVLDPLNNGNVQTRDEPNTEISMIGMSFTEEMRGFWSLVPDGEAETDFWNLESFRDGDHLKMFVRAESEGIEKGRTLRVDLNVTADDLARVIAPESSIERPRMRVTGCGALRRSGGEMGFEIRSASFMQMFIPHTPGTKSPKYFRYDLRYIINEKPYALNGLKVLSDAPGFDAWHDTSTLYFEGNGPRGRYRGILRVPLDTFLRQQLPSMEISGTTDAARKCWALGAFYKYFAGELADVYLGRGDALRDAFLKLVTGIHV